MLLVCSAVVLSSFAAGEDPPAKPLIPKGASQFSFVDPVQPKRPFKVFIYRPSKFKPKTSPVLFVMHGMKRNGEEYRDPWITHAVKHKALLVVPEFSKASFPSSSDYNCGRVLDARGELIPKEQWSFRLIESLFDEVRARTEVAAERYHIYGHSAGSQFVHRLVLQMPEARIERAVCANAGSYSMPDFGVDYPYGLGKSAANLESLESSFALEVIVLLGKLDTDENSSSLPKARHAMAQGPHRLARGRNFFETSKLIAQDLECDFAWKLRVVNGVGHTNSGMSRAAAKALFD